MSGTCRATPGLLSDACARHDSLRRPAGQDGESGYLFDLSNWESGRRSVPSAVLLQAVAVPGGSADALLARARDRAAAGSSAGAAAGEVDLAGQEPSRVELSKVPALRR